MKLVQLNIWQGKLLDAAVKLLKKEDADIVCLQEVFSSEVFLPLLDMFGTLETLKKELGYPHVFYAPTQSFETSQVKSHFGNAILSKMPLNEQLTIFTNNDFHHVDDWRTNVYNTRNAQITKIEVSGRPLLLVNHHGYHELNKFGSEKTIQAMKVLVDKIKNIKLPTILTGDLNVVPESKVMRLFDGYLEDLTATHKLTSTLSQFGKVKDVPCDHILVSPEIKVNRFEVSDALVSDHTPLIFEFEL